MCSKLKICDSTCIKVGVACRLTPKGSFNQCVYLIISIQQELKIKSSRLVLIVLIIFISQSARQIGYVVNFKISTNKKINLFKLINLSIISYFYNSSD